MRTDSAQRRPKKAESALHAREGRPGGDRARQGWTVLSAILLVGLALRLAYLRELVRKPDFDAPIADASFNDYWARGLADGDWSPPRGEPDPKIASTPYFRPPGYPYCLAAVYGVCGSSYLAPRLVQTALGLVNCVLAFWLGRALWGQGAGLTVAALMSVYWVFIYFEGELQPPVLLAFLALVFMHLARLCAIRPTGRRALACGLVLGLFALVRPNVLLIVPVALAWGWWVLRRREGGPRFAFTAAGIVGGTVLAVLPVTARNYLVARDFVLISANGGVNLYIGNNPHTSLVTPRIPDIEQIAGRSGWNLFAYNEIVRGVERKTGQALTYSQASRYFGNKAIEFIKANSLTVLGYAARRAALFWGPHEVSNNKVIHYEKQDSATLRYLPGFPFVASGFVTGLVLWILDRRAGQAGGGKAETGARLRSQLVVLLLVWIAVYSASFLPFLVAGRFRVPLIPLLLLFAGYGLWRGGQLVWARRPLKAAAVAVLWAGLYVAASRSLVAYEPDLASWHLDRATAHVRRGRLDRAIEEYHRALEARPAAPDTYALLGSALAEQGRFDEALQSYRRAVEINPAFAECRRKLALLLESQGRLDEAIAEYRAALRLSPENAEALYNLGRVLMERGLLAEAVEKLRHAVRLEPSFVEARVNLGVTLRRQGRLDAAVEEFRRALRTAPASFEACFNLGSALAAQGRIDEAIAELEAALRIRPNDATTLRVLQTLRAELDRASRPQPSPEPRP